MNHLLSDGRADAHLVGLSILFHEVPIGEERVVKGYDIDIPQVSHVVTASEIGELYRFAGLYPFLCVRNRESDPKRLNDGLARIISLERIFLGSRSEVEVANGWCTSVRSGMSKSLKKFMLAEP
jgi:hypothetical protein